MKDLIKELVSRLTMVKVEISYVNVDGKIVWRWCDINGHHYITISGFGSRYRI